MLLVWITEPCPVCICSVIGQVCFSISQIGLISKIPVVAKHELLNMQKIYQSSQVFNSFAWKFYWAILSTYKFKSLQTMAVKMFYYFTFTPSPLQKSTFQDELLGNLLWTTAFGEEVLSRRSEVRRPAMAVTVITLPVEGCGLVPLNGRCRQKSACWGRSRGLQKGPPKQDTSLPASPVVLQRLPAFLFSASLSVPSSSHLSLLLPPSHFYLGVLSL